MQLIIFIFLVLFITSKIGKFLGYAWRRTEPNKEGTKKKKGQIKAKIINSDKTNKNTTIKKGEDKMLGFGRKDELEGLDLNEAKELEVEAKNIAKQLIEEGKLDEANKHLDYAKKLKKAIEKKKEKIKKEKKKLMENEKKNDKRESDKNFARTAGNYIGSFIDGIKESMH
jgi:hypothetical protein